MRKGLVVERGLHLTTQVLILEVVEMNTALNEETPQTIRPNEIPADTQHLPEEMNIQFPEETITHPLEKTTIRLP